MPARQSADNQAFELARRVVEAIHEPSLLLDGRLQVRYANPAFEELCAGHTEITAGQELCELGRGEWDFPPLKQLLDKLLESDAGTPEELTIEQEFEDLGWRSMTLSARRLDDIPAGDSKRQGEQVILLTVQDLTEQQRTADRLARQALEATLLHRATVLAAETSSFEEALESCVEIVCELTGWPVGHVCLPDPNDPEVLVTTNIWHFKNQGVGNNRKEMYARLRQGTESLRFKPGVGLPGTIWESGEPDWVANLQNAGKYLRGKLAQDTGIRGAFGFPVKIRNETVAVLEFFSEKPMSPDRPLLSIVRTLGEQVGRVIERNRAGLALQLREQELSELFETAAVGLLFLSVTGTVLRANRTFLQNLGYTLPEIVGKPIRDLLADAGAGDPLDRSCKTGEPLTDYEVRWRRRDGGTRVALLDANARRENGSVVYLRCFARDITDRKRDELERARLAAIVQSSDDAIIGLSPDGLITSWNHGAERLYGFTVQEVLGGPIGKIVPAEREDEMAGLLATVRRGERVEQYETVRTHREGRRIHVSMTASPIRPLADDLINSDDLLDAENSTAVEPADLAAGITGVAVIERDISERKRVAAEIRRAVQEAERANRAKGEFLANVSHELRTPMNAIIGMTELALDEDLSPEVRDYLDTAKDSAEILLRLLNEILDFSRIESGKFELDEAKFQLRDTLEETVKSLAMYAHSKGLEITLQMPPLVPDRLIGDPVRLRQVVSNLINNAIKFTEQGEVRVRAELYALRENEAEIHFLVQDTGIGISESDQERVFSPFAQVDATTTRHHGGAGLGLAICRELVGMMDGRIWLESERYQGSTFHFTCRFGLQPDSEGHTPAHVRELKGLPVLVVDDNATNRKILEETLKNWHMEPQTVPDAASALAVLQQAAEDETAFPLVIVDGLMPGTDGFSLVEQIREDHHLAGSTVLMLSSADRRLFRDRCERLDIAAYLEKPVTQSELLDSIVTALKGPPLEKEAVDSAEKISGAEEPLSVLLVEDTPANRKVVTAVLNKRGHSVTIATDGREAVDLYRQRRDFDVVLMDVQMPNMDGFQATGIIRTIESSRGSHAPIIAMTAHAMRGDRERCLAAGMDAYISKPIDVRRMIKLIERTVRRHRRLAAGLSQDEAIAQDDALSQDDVLAQDDYLDPVESRAAGTQQLVDESESYDASAVQSEPESSPVKAAPQKAPRKTATRKSGSKGTGVKSRKKVASGHASAPEAIYDRASALERLGGDEQLLRELAAYYLEDAEIELQRIDAGIVAGDWSSVRVAAHSLKGLSANFSGQAATAAARELESTVHETKSTSDLKSLVASVRTETERLKAVLKSVAKEAPGSK